MKLALTSCFSLLTFLVVTPTWASSVNLDSDQKLSSVFSEDQHQFLIDSDLHFSVDQSSVELNAVSVEKIAIAAFSPSQQLTAQNTEDFKLSHLNSTFLNSSINAADLQLDELRENHNILSGNPIPSLSNLEENTLSQNPINLDPIVNEVLAEDSQSSTPTIEQPQSNNGWRFEVEPMLFVPFNIDGYAIVGEGASVNRFVLVDLITTEITNRILNQLPQDLIEKAVDRVLERLPFDRRNNRLEDRIAQEVRERLQQRGQDLTERLETQIREGVQTIVDRVPPGQVPVEVDFNFGLGKILEFDKILELGTRLEAWNGDIGLIFQGVYSELGLTEKGSEIDINFNTELLTAEVLLAWHLGTLPLRAVKDTSKPSPVYPSLDFELYGGTRFGYLNTDFGFDPGPDINYRPDWFDPSLGAQIQLNLADNLAITTRGGTAITGGSEALANWDLLIGLDWQVSRDLTLSAGYRLYQLKVEKEGDFGTSTVKMTSQGMRLGLGWSF
ncbi:MAG: outer membrane protein [Planktothrix sp.]